MAPRENRIKEVRYTYSFSSTTTGSFPPNVGSSPINGEILSVDWSFDRAGSVSLKLSDTDEEFWRRNAPSGTATQVSVPFKFSESTTGSIASAEHVPFVAKSTPYLVAVSGLSGTQPFSLNILYR